MSAGANGCDEYGSQYEAEPVPIRPACAFDPTVSAAANAATTNSVIRPILATATESSRRLPLVLVFSKQGATHHPSGCLDRVLDPSDE